MTDLTLFPADIAELSVSQLAALSPVQKQEVIRHLDEALAWLKQARAKLDTALEQAYGDRARAARLEIGKDFGVIHLADGAVRVTVDVPKRVSWDQKQLARIAESLAAAGQRVEDYLEVQLSVPESRFTQWPPALKARFEAARTVKPGKASFQLTLVSED